MIRIVGGLIAGILVFAAILLLVQFLEDLIGLSFGSTTALAIVAAAYLPSSFLGGLVAASISRRHWTAWAIPLLVAAGVAYSLAMLPHPAWMQIATIIAALLGGFAASRMAPAQPSAGRDAAL